MMVKDLGLEQGAKSADEDGESEDGSVSEERTRRESNNKTPLVLPLAPKLPSRATPMWSLLAQTSSLSKLAKFVFVVWAVLWRFSGRT